MPPEDHYRPQKRSPGTRGVLWFGIWIVATFTLFWTTASMTAIGAVLLVLSIGFYWQRHTHLGAVEENQGAIQLLNAGYVDEAADRFEALTRQEKRTTGHPVFVHNRAVAYMLQGRLRRAYSLFNAVDYSRHFRWGANRAYEPLLYVEMATCLALLGDLGEARTYRDRAARSLPSSENARLAVVDAILGLRVERPGDVLRMFDRIWNDASELLRPPTFKAMMLLKAYALQMYGPDYEHRIRQLIAEATRGSSAGDFDYLSAEWPELRHFFEARGLLGHSRHSMRG